MKIIKNILIFFVLSLFFSNPIYAFGKTHNTIAIICAMDIELESIVKQLEIKKRVKNSTFNVTVGRYQNKNIILAISGVGKVNAAAMSQYLIDKYKPKYIINSGVVGSLTNDLNYGDVVLVDKALQHDFDLSMFGRKKGCLSEQLNKNEPTYFYTDENLTRILKKILVQKYPKIRTATIATGDVFVHNYEQKKYLNTEFKADIVDMEAAAIIQIANKNKTPIVSVKTISDNLKIDLANYIKFDEEKYAKETANTMIDILNSL